MSTMTTDGSAAVDSSVGSAVAAARQAVAAMAGSSAADRALWLTTVAAALEANIGDLVRVAAAETHLGEQRLRGEISRTANQLRLFADVVAEGSYLEATLDSADPTALPPRPDLRRMLRPLGAVAVFGASNFPFAFSVLGGDTASALAAGCPVIVKANPGHPETSELTASIAIRALRKTGAPDGALGLVHGLRAGSELVQHHDIRAVGFTGSEAGGRALFELATLRPDPIPFYGELGSLNPVVLTRAALAERQDSIVAGFIASFSNDGGQLCTKPGVVFAPADSRFPLAVRDALPTAAWPGGRLLTDGIGSAFERRTRALSERDGVEVIAGALADGSGRATPLVLGVSASVLLEHSGDLLEECFGPTALVVRYQTEAELLACLTAIPPSLTATIHHGQAEDVSEVAQLAVTGAGRVIFNGWPTGVALGWAQHHGGSWPATTASLHTSVGATAIRRWLTPVSYQNAPESLLPDALRDGNPLSIPRRVDGRLIAPAD